MIVILLYVDIKQNTIIHRINQLRYKYNSENCITGEYALKLLTKSENYGYFITPIVNNKIYDADF